MKYKAIYEVLEKAPVQYRNDLSGWNAACPTYMDKQRPLRIIVESKEQGLRIWICHEFGKLYIAVANLNLNSESREYHESYRRYRCATQKEMADTLRKLLFTQEGQCV